MHVDGGALHCRLMDTMIGSVRSPLLIGRDALLELVDRRMDEVDVGHGRFLLVAGIAGVGKSRFLSAVARKARERGYDDIWGHIAPLDQDVPGASIRDLARTAASHPRYAGMGTDVLAMLEAPRETTVPGRRRFALDVVERILAGPDQPSLLVFEDLQWADDLSLDIIGQLARQARERHILLLAGYRNDELLPGSSLRDWRSRLVTQRIAEELRLGPLSEQETALVTTLILDTGLPAPRDVAHAVYARTDGIPLYIEELLGAISADVRANGRAVRDAVVPDTIEDAVISRLMHRSRGAQEAARAGAVIGRCFTADVLGAIMDVPEEALDGPLQELCDHFLLTPPGDDGYFDFPHQLLREAVYRSVKVGDRRRYHARAGRFGSRLAGQSEVHASAHFERAGMHREAHETALAGAREAARLSLHREAFDLYRRALAHMPADLPTADRATIFEQAFSEAYAVEENAIADELGRQAAAAYRADGAVVKAIGVAETLEVLSRRSGRPASAWMPSVAAMIDELEGLPVSPERDEALAGARLDLTTGLIDRREMGAARAVLASIREYGQHGGDDEWLEIAEWRDGLIDVLEGAVSAGLERIARVAVKAARAGQEGLGVTAYRDTAVHATLAMDYRMASRMLAEGLRYADSVQQSYCAHHMTASSALVDWAEGRCSEAADLAGHAIADHGCRRGAELGRWSFGYVQMGRGDLTGAEASLREGLAFGIASETIDYTLQPLWGLAEVALQNDDPEAAVAHCQDALDRARAVGERLLLVPFVVTGVRAFLGLGRPADAAAWLAACETLLGSMPDVAGPALDHGRGLVALSDGATGVARTALRSAVDRWEAKPRVWEASWARLDLATCLVRSGRYAEALALADDVRAVASRLGSPALAARADEVGRMARGRIVDEDPWRPLTAREFAVARLIAEGRTNAEIAAELGIAPKTASSHVEHILAKLGVSRRAEIATWTGTVERRAGQALAG
jgi:DNA-binding CsgD family transcriptional regulator